MIIENSIPSSIRISTNKEDFESQLFVKAPLREGFQEHKDEIQIPVFISKLNNNSQEFISKIREDFRLRPNNTLMFSGFHILKNEPKSYERIPKNVISEDGEVDVILAGQIDEIRALTPAKREILYLAIKKIVATKNDIEAIAELSALDIFSYAILENEKVLTVFNNADFKNIPPKCVVVDSGKSILNPCAVFRLLLMHVLAFDIVVSSYKSHTSIEDYFPENYYDVYYYEEEKKNYAVTKDKKPVLPFVLWGGFALIIAYVVLHWGLSII